MLPPKWEGPITVKQGSVSILKSEHLVNISLRQRLAASPIYSFKKNRHKTFSRYQFLSPNCYFQKDQLHFRFFAAAPPAACFLLVTPDTVLEFLSSFVDLVTLHLLYEANTVTTISQNVSHNKYRVGQNMDNFWTLVTLQWLAVERRVICQKFANFV